MYKNYLTIKNYPEIHRSMSPRQVTKEKIVMPSTLYVISLGNPFLLQQKQQRALIWGDGALKSQPVPLQ